MDEMFSIRSDFWVSGGSVVKIGVHVVKIESDVGIIDGHVRKNRGHVGIISSFLQQRSENKNH
ncbi:hypothetical protein ACQKE5_02850 [Paenisporosarcina sp. NPDC076898]|uniref:hypothetical protein n=1 Tax=Paenisporosarcina sp. NPDC076898 TaxID=3390603 RepID=UPI003CFEF0B6